LIVPEFIQSRFKCVSGALVVVVGEVVVLEVTLKNKKSQTRKHVYL